MYSNEIDSEVDGRRESSVRPFSSGSSRIADILGRGLGVVWFVAGVLQFQPLMFTPDFYAWYPPSIMESTIQTAADDQPHFVMALVHLGSNIWSVSPIVFNVSAALLQLAIGIALVFGRQRVRRTGLVLSIIWGTLVWIGGEAFGDVFGGSTYFDGFPGAALLYVISSILLLAYGGANGVATSRLRNALRYLTSVFWFAVAYFQVVPSSGFWQPRGLMEPFANEAAQPGPGFLAQPVEHFTFVVQSHTPLINLLIVLVMVAMAFLTLLDLWNPVTITVAGVWLFWSWWFGQGFGGIFTGAGTDVNSIPLIGLWMVSLWATKRKFLVPQKLPGN